MAVERFAVAVLMARVRIQGKWAGERWEARGVLPGTIAESANAPMARTLVDGDGEFQRLHAGYFIELRRDEAQGYYLNVSAQRPSAFVMWRMQGAEAVPLLVTASYDEGARWLDAGESVDAVPLPDELREPIARFAQAHYRPEAKRARKRDRFAVSDTKAAEDGTAHVEDNKFSGAGSGSDHEPVTDIKHD